MALVGQGVEIVAAHPTLIGPVPWAALEAQLLATLRDPPRPPVTRPPPALPPAPTVGLTAACRTLAVRAKDAARPLTATDIADELGRALPREDARALAALVRTLVEASVARVAAELDAGELVDAAVEADADPDDLLEAALDAAKGQKRISEAVYWRVREMSSLDDLLDLHRRAERCGDWSALADDAMGELREALDAHSAPAAPVVLGLEKRYRDLS